ncbi:MAG TPA: hypothetical protein DD473_14015, partial [Planctomycetaceae bacterium]|nr:hypothetical protein [Planctomycetaceae bacterium]
GQTCDPNNPDCEACQ